MDAIVFLGPTLPRDAAAEVLDADYRPPAAQGDVYRAVRDRPRAIGIVDGYFHGVPAVWHKEILWAMQQGIHVYGSASMGALRAAELAAFGMCGVGEIFAAFRDGTLTDDDEVAVLHGPAETGYRPLTEPMVNLRATLHSACRQSVISAATSETLVQAGKALFYQQRNWPTVLEHARGLHADHTEIDALERWLPTGRVDAKQRDACAMLALMAERLASVSGPMQVNYHFEHTQVWNEAVARFDAIPAGHAGDKPAVMDELRLDPDRFIELGRRALLRRLLLREAGRRNMPAAPATVRVALRQMRERLGLYSRHEVDEFLDTNALTATGFDALIRDEARITAVSAIVGTELEAGILDELRLAGDYTALAERARAKHAVLGRAGREAPAPQDIGLTPAQLAAWYFDTRQGRAIPDLDAHAATLGLARRSEFYRLVAAEYIYWQSLDARVAAIDAATEITQDGTPNADSGDGEDA